MKIDPNAFLPPPVIAAHIQGALQVRKPLALIRIGDGEALTLSQGTVCSVSYVASQGFLREAGVMVPDFTARARVADAVRLADFVGVAARRDLPNFAPLTEAAFAYLGLHPRRLCDCCINYALQGHGLLIPLLRGKRLFLVNRRWTAWAEALKRLYGLCVVGGAFVDHFGQIPAALTAAEHQRFDVALVAAGVPATWLSVALARRKKCVALDVGRLADLMIGITCQEKPGSISTSQ